MKKLVFIALGFFVMSAFTNTAAEKKELSKLTNSLQAAQQENANLDVKLFSAIDSGTSEEVYNLLKRGANPDARMDWGNEKNIPAIFFAISRKNPIIIDVLLMVSRNEEGRGKGADCAIEYQGETPLSYAILHNVSDAKIIMYLINDGKNTDIYKVYNNGYSGTNGTVLTEAVNQNIYGYIFNFLLVKGGNKLADIRQPRTGNTPLMMAINSGNIMFVQTLLKYNVNLTLKNNEGKTALVLAKEKLSHSKEMYEMYQKQYVKGSSIVAEWKNHVDDSKKIVDLLVQAGAK
jgi:ankyrin repeat protein